MPIWSLRITLRIVIKINILTTSPLVIVVRLVLTTLRRMLARMLMLLGMGVVTEPYSKNYGGSCYWAGYIDINRSTT